MLWNLMGDNGVKGLNVGNQAPCVFQKGLLVPQLMNKPAISCRILDAGLI